jgi:arylsulfatase A-like enzyme/Flp pilus assembly protein TadD
MSLRARPAWLCIATLLAAGSLTGCGRERPWNVLLFSFDTTRADFLGCYGKTSARTPNLDRLAAEGFLFEHAYASNPVTQASHSTLLTGVYPMVHGVRDNTFFHLPDERRTLAESLAAEGYATGAAIGGFPLTREFGTAQGFDFYDDDLTAARSDFRGRPAERRFATWYDERPAGHVNDAILPWLRQPRDRPFFVWLHYWDPHEPHIAPAPYGQLFAHDPYQGEIAYADDSLGVILRELETSGELGRTLIVMTADHGEGRQEHRETTHAFLAYDTTLHVPLILRVPGRQGGRRIAERVGTVDVVPTVLDLLGLEVPDDLQGRSLAGLLDGTADADRRPYYSESMSPRLSHGFGELRALYLGPWKYVHGPRPELFHLKDDPRELHDLAAERPEEARSMQAALRTFLAEHASPAAADAAYEAGEETRRRLAALGYLATGGDGPRTVTEELRGDGEAPQDRVGDVNLQGRLRRELGGGRYREAERTARRLLEGSPHNPFYRASLAAALVGLDDVDAAARVVEEADELPEADPEPFLAVARALFDAGQRQRGLDLARRVAAAADTAAAEVTLARMLLDAADAAAFEAAVARALELEPGHRGARLELVRHHRDRGELDRAEDELQRLLADYPVDIAGHLEYARLRRAQGRVEEALEDLDRALRLAPAACEAHLERVTALAELGRREAAAAALDEMRDACRAGDLLEQAAAAVEDTR